ncbi:endonuclease VII domain-containing protein [Streptacidiphilus jeojiensis]|uniref:endonuclease VII domain-containing protein n=1 Tax=Streptacidiphilus jeojiensis TaxID=3229225 RepID=UPI0036D42E6A
MCKKAGSDPEDHGIQGLEGACPSRPCFCAICLTPGPEHVDHDHKTGRVRAILCFNCNGGLGQFKDRPDLLRRGADYLEGNVWKPTLVAPGVYRLPS